MLCGLYNSNYGRRQTFALLKDEKDYETKYDNNLKWICGLHFMLHNHCMQELNQSVSIQLRSICYTCLSGGNWISVSMDFAVERTRDNTIQSRPWNISIIQIYLNGGRFQVPDVTYYGPASHQHEQVSQHVLLLGVPKWVCKLSSILQEIMGY